jgi:hypothetical protein
VITAHVEQIRDVLHELMPHFDAHWREFALDQDKVPLAPQWGVYAEREAKGEALCVTLRERGEVKGYFVGFVAPGMHYAHCLTLTMDLAWIHPDLRAGSADDSLARVEEQTALAVLFDAVRTEAIRRGVQRAFFGSKLHRDVGPFYESFGAREVERYYSVWWGES